MTGRLPGEGLRETMRQVPSSVVVITAVGASDVRGMTVGSFTSVSLDPPLISFNVSDDCRMHPVIMSAERFNVSLLSDQQMEASRHFAEPEPDGLAQLAGLPHTLDQWGVPELSGSLALLSCTTWARHPAGDHVMVIGHVEKTRFDPDSRPLIYLDRTYHRVGRLIGSQDWPL